jgi:hypothetical protein
MVRLFDQHLNNDVEVNYFTVSTAFKSTKYIKYQKEIKGFTKEWEDN